MGSAGAQNTRPASAPGEDAPSAGSADRNEVNISDFCFLNWLGLLHANTFPNKCCVLLSFPNCFLSLMGVVYSTSSD